MSSVYSYPFPEVRDYITKLGTLDQKFYINTTTVEQATKYLEAYESMKDVELPSDAGYLDLDELWLPVADKMRELIAPYLRGIESYEYRYPVAGSSPAIFHILAEWKASGLFETLGVLKGEYEGYKAYAESLGIKFNEYDTLPGSAKASELWFISCPNAKDGNWIEAETIDQFVKTGANIVFDMAYVGLAPPRAIDLSSPNILAVLTSPSKTYGVFRHRKTGITYARRPINSMFGNKWFNNIPNLIETLEITQAFGYEQIQELYRPVQKAICMALSAELGVEVTPSDVLLLAHISGENQLPAKYDEFKRGNVYRFGLTKLFELYERDQE